jgi:hypothetical protein
VAQCCSVFSGILLAGALILLVPATTTAQATGTISGLVTDATNAALPAGGEPRGHEPRHRFDASFHHRSGWRLCHSAAPSGRLRRQSLAHGILTNGSRGSTGGLRHDIHD